VPPGEGEGIHKLQAWGMITDEHAYSHSPSPFDACHVSLVQRAVLKKLWVHLSCVSGASNKSGIQSTLFITDAIGPRFGVCNRVHNSGSCFQ